MLSRASPPAAPVCLPASQEDPGAGMTSMSVTPWPARREPTGSGVDPVACSLTVTASTSLVARTITAVCAARDAIDAFASTTCCVAVTSTPAGLQVYARHGLNDVFARHMGPNPRLAPRQVYEAKISQYQRRWPSLAAPRSERN